MKEITIIIFLLAQAASLNAYACSCKKGTTTQKYQKASKVFIAHITSTKEIINNRSGEPYFKGNHIKAVYNVKEIFKGSPVNGGSITDRVYNGINCSLAIVAGQDYIIFQYDSNRISTCNGSTYYGNKHSDKIISTLKMLRQRHEKKHNK